MLLRGAAAAFGVAFALHVADHARRGLDASPPSVAIIGAAQAVLVVLAVAMAWTGRRGAPVAAISVGTLSALLVTLGHLVPRTEGYGDSFLSPSAIGVTWTSWTSAIVELGAALVFATAGVLARAGGRGRA